METTAPEDREPVKLVVKSPNQQFEDHTVDCEPQWSVKQLKEHLFEVYPCKPTPEEQKLIYSGQLLKDQLILKDVLRHYDDPQPLFHILHLVYTPKNQPNMVPNSIKGSQRVNDTTDGLRYRHATNQSQQVQSQNVNSTPNIAAGNANIATTAPSTTNCPASGHPIGGMNNIPAYGYPQETNQYLLAQQMAIQNWMQQAYVQYMNQYMSLLSEGMGPEAFFMQHQAQPYMAYPPSHALPFSPQFFGQNLPGSPLSPPTVGVPDAQTGTVTNEVPNTPAPAAAAAAAAQPQPQVQEPQAQPRFPNLVQENPEEHRDWLDIFYMMIRVMVLLTLIYVYSSALRCGIVIFIGMAIYLYHIGFFRRHLQGREANNNNVAAAVENIQQQQQQQHNQGANARGDNEAEPPADGRPAATANSSNREGSANDGGVIAPSSAPEVPEASGTSVIAFVRTFVVSFFVSLLPETPAL